MAKILGVHIPASPRNSIINGALDFWQRVNGTTTTVNTATTQNALAADRIKYESGGATTKNYSIVRSTDVPSQSQSAFQSTYSYLFTMLTGIASPAAGDYTIPFEYRMEGLDYEKLHSKTVTLSFWSKASIAGTYSVAFTNSALNRSYVTTFVQNGAATWELKTITVTLDAAGTWLFDTGIGLEITIGAVTGTTFQTGSTNAWTAGNFYAATGATNWMSTTNAALQIAQLSLVEGPLFVGFERSMLSIQAELARCQRYYETCDSLICSANILNSVTWLNIPFKVSKRVAATTTFGATGNNQANAFTSGASIGAVSVTPSSLINSAQFNVAASYTGFSGVIYNADAEL